MGDQTQAYDIFQTPLSSGYPLPLRRLSGVYLLYTVAAAVTDPLLCINVSVDVPNNPDSASVFFLSLNVLCVISIK